MHGHTFPIPDRGSLFEESLQSSVPFLQFSYKRVLVLVEHPLYYAQNFLECGQFQIVREIPPLIIRWNWHILHGSGTGRGTALAYPRTLLHGW